MKQLKNSLLIVCLLFFGTTQAQTTFEEYKYVNNGGLQDYIVKGGNLLNGYALESTGIVTPDILGKDRVTRKARVYQFRKKSNNRIVCYAIHCDDDKRNHRVLCVPTSNAAVLENAYFEIVEDISEEWNSVLKIALFKLAAYQLNQLNQY